MTTLLRRKRTYGLAVAVVALAGLSIIVYWLMPAASDQTTNDAFVAADFTALASRVSGQVGSVPVEDNQVVHQGQLLVQLDDRDYVVAVAAAAANVSAAQAVVQNAQASLTQQQAVIEQAAATLAASRANQLFARADAERYADLANHGAGSTQNAQQARARVDSAQANVARDEASLKAAKQKTAILVAERARTEGDLKHAQAALDAAQLNLSYTRIVAPIDGMVGQRTVRVGAYVTPGSPLLAVVPLARAYVVGNFQEDQLTHVLSGQPVDVHVDSFPGVNLRGTVDSFAPATGVTFAALAPDNATGNFTKVVQRIPVKIVLLPGQAMTSRLRVGMSVEATVHTDSGRTNTSTPAVATR